MKRQIVNCLVVVAFGVLGQKIFAQQYIGNRLVRTGEWRGRQIEYAVGELIFVVREGMDPSHVQRYLDAEHPNVRYSIDELGVGKLKVLDDEDIFSLASVLEQQPDIVAVHPNRVGHLHSDVNDPYFQAGYQWALKNIGQSPPSGTIDADIDAPEAWNYTMGSSSDTIAVLDSGIPLVNGVPTHPDLSTPGKFILGPNYVSPGTSVRDLFGHGTHVTGIIAAEANDSVGVAGVAPNVKVLVIKTATDQGDMLENMIYDAIKYACDHNASIINISGGFDIETGDTGGIGFDDETLSDLIRAVNYAKSHDVLIVASTGNDGARPVDIPAALASDFSNVISVGNTNANDEWRFSCYESSFGDSAVVVAAPGGNVASAQDATGIFSTLPNYAPFTAPYYGYKSGTSMSAPFVTGVAALIKARWPDASAVQIRKIIEKSADDVEDPGYDEYTGYGRVNAFHAVAPPPRPTNVAVSAGPDNHPRVSWDVPAPDVVSYKIKRKTQSPGSSTYSYTYFNTTDNPWRDPDIEIGGSLNVYYYVKAKDYTSLWSSYSLGAHTTYDGGFFAAEEDSASIFIQEEGYESEGFFLSPSSPNPFNASTNIRFKLFKSEHVRIQIYDVQGRLTQVLFDGVRNAGWHELAWDAGAVSSGTYFMAVNIGETVQTQKLVVIK